MRQFHLESMSVNPQRLFYALLAKTSIWERYAKYHDDNTAAWDFWSLSPETLHQVMILMRVVFQIY